MRNRPIEKVDIDAVAIKAGIKAAGLSIRQVSAMVGYSDRQIRRYFSIGKMPKELCEEIIASVYGVVSQMGFKPFNDYKDLTIKYDFDSQVYNIPRGKQRYVILQNSFYGGCAMLFCESDIKRIPGTSIPHDAKETFAIKCIIRYDSLEQIEGILKTLNSQVELLKKAEEQRKEE